MTTELGHFALILAALVAAVQTVLPAWGAHVRDARLMAMAEPASLTQMTLVALCVPGAAQRVRDFGFLGRTVLRTRIRPSR